MGDQDKEKSMENPDVVHKVCDGPWLHQTERTVHATAPRLCSVPKSHPALLISGQSSQVAMDGTNLSGLQTDPAAADTRDVLPTDQANLTGTQQDGQEHRESDEEVESSNANRDGDQHERVADGTANVPATLSKEDLLEAMKVMGTQMVAMAQLFTPLVNSSVGQATPVATTTPNTNGPVVETVEVIEIDPPE
ncbi:unnamed protein product, partial [Brassica rapa]